MPQTSTTTTSPIFQKFIVLSGADCEGSEFETEIVGTYNDADEAADARHEFREGSEGTMRYHLVDFGDLVKYYPHLVDQKWEVVPRELIIEEVTKPVTTLYKNDLGHRLDIEKVMSLLNNHNFVCRDKIEMEWATQPGTSDNCILCFDPIPEELMFKINETVMVDPPEPSADRIPTIFEGDEVRYMVEEWGGRKVSVLGEVFDVKGKGTLFNVRRKDGPVEWVNLGMVTAVFPKFK